MQMPDVNVLIGAFRADSLLRARCVPWFEATLRNSSQLGLSPLILAAVIRVTTNHRTHSPPSRREDAIGFANDLLALPNTVKLEPGPRHWTIFTKLLDTADILGPATTDAWFAALAIEHDCTFVTLDRDFSRFPGLKWTNPA